jgi:hypothetical protein
MPPLPGSPAIDAGGTTALTTDQRGANDGIDDRLEQGIFGNLTTANASSDNDGDGSSDKDEIANMTNPLSSGDYLRLLSFNATAVAGEFTFTMSTFPGLEYFIEASDSSLTASDALPSGTKAFTMCAWIKPEWR